MVIFVKSIIWVLFLNYDGLKSLADVEILDDKMKPQLAIVSFYLNSSLQKRRCIKETIPSTDGIRGQMKLFSPILSNLLHPF